MRYEQAKIKIITQKRVKSRNIGYSYTIINSSLQSFKKYRKTSKQNNLYYINIS